MIERDIAPLDSLFVVPAPFVAEATGRVIPVHLLPPGAFGGWSQAQSPAHRAAMAEQGFSGGIGKVFCGYAQDGHLECIALGLPTAPGPYDYSAAADFIRKTFAEEVLKGVVFRFEAREGGFAPDPNAAALGWALGCYGYHAYRQGPPPVLPRLMWAEGADRRLVEALLAGICLTRNLVNAPANALGPAELQAAAEHLARLHGASLVVTAGQTLETEHPLIHAVGKGSPRGPSLIDLTWSGRSSGGSSGGSLDGSHDPRLTLVGKGVCFDTGGLNLKPGSAMSLMKKDMGGAAHALGLARTLMTLNLPLRLRVLVPAVENAVSGEAFRPRDVIRSRKGLSVEIMDTDAEGRLVLADALTLACEEKPDLLIDFATLTGAARVALGFELPALFGNRPTSVAALKDAAFAQADPLWDLPLWRPYLKEMDSDIADLANIGTGPAGCIQAALFLEKFVAPEVDWLHIDQYAWEQAGRPGRPKGGCDMGLRAVLAYLRHRFAL